MAYSIIPKVFSAEITSRPALFTIISVGGPTLEEFLMCVSNVH